LSTFKQYLLEFESSAEKLTSSPEFAKFQAADASFATKLINAWKGDADHYKRNQKFDPLFDKMLTHEALAKFSPKSALLKQEASKLIQLHRATFPYRDAVKRPNDNDIWKDNASMKRGSN
jgi:hypothetical protein